MITWRLSFESLWILWHRITCLYGLKPISDVGTDTTDADTLHYAGGNVDRVPAAPESFRAFAIVALQLLLEEEVN